MLDAIPARVRAQFEALLFEPMLRPLQSAFGEYGEIATQGFTQALASTLERAHE